MRKKALLVVLVVLVAMTASLYAASVGSIGLVNYARLEAFENEDTNAYVPGIRGEFFFSDYLGVSADAMVIDSIEAIDLYEMLYVIDIMARLPFGFIEPYAGLGPVYHGYIYDGESYDDEESIGFNVRTGVDVNLLEWLSVGAEVNFFVDDLEAFFDNADAYFSEEGIREAGLIGITAKFKF